MPKIITIKSGDADGGFSYDSDILDWRFASEEGPFWTINDDPRIRVTGHISEVYVKRHSLNKLFDVLPKPMTVLFGQHSYGGAEDDGVVIAPWSIFSRNNITIGYSPAANRWVQLDSRDKYRPPLFDKKVDITDVMYAVLAYYNQFIK